MILSTRYVSQFHMRTVPYELLRVRLTPRMLAAPAPFTHLRFSRDGMPEHL